MNRMMGGMQQAAPIMMPPVPVTAYHVAVNGQAEGPYDLAALAQMAAAGVFTKSCLVWKQGMVNWAAAETVQELQGVFHDGIPPVLAEAITGP